MKIAVVYDPESSHIGAVRDHALSVGRLPGFAADFLPVRSTEDEYLRTGAFAHYDWVICHYSVRLPSLTFAVFLNDLALHQGRKALFIQDEYDHVGQSLEWMRKIQFDIVFSVVPESEIPKVYHPENFPNTRFISILTGYVPEWAEHKSEWIPFEKRPIDVGYRGRELPWRYGCLGRMKYHIGREFQRHNDGRFRVDISSDENDRIYGPAWPAFLEQCRFTLGSESGCNFFDWDGTLDETTRNFLAKNPRATFEDYTKEVIRGRESEVTMNQISPRIFEAIGAKTALLLYKGGYSGVLDPYVHYWPLEHDFSNWNETAAFMKDHKAVQAMIERAHHDIIGGQKWTYGKFSEKIASALRDIPCHGAHAHTEGTAIRSELNAFSELFSALRLAEPFSMKEIRRIGEQLRGITGYDKDWRERSLTHVSTARGLFGAFFLCALARGIRMLQTKILGHATATVPRIWQMLPIQKKWTDGLEYYLDLMRKHVI